VLGLHRRLGGAPEIELVRGVGAGPPRGRARRRGLGLPCLEHAERTERALEARDQRVFRERVTAGETEKPRPFEELAARVALERLDRRDAAGGAGPATARRSTGGNDLRGTRLRSGFRPTVDEKRGAADYPRRARRVNDARISRSIAASSAPSSMRTIRVALLRRRILA
jgi:hypothetical protein